MPRPDEVAGAMEKIRVYTEALPDRLLTRSAALVAVRWLVVVGNNCQLLLT
jgi:hypothetical protein